MKEPGNIPADFDNLEKYAPTLAKIAKQNPFGVPENYFEENCGFVSSHIKLLSIKKEGGFIVPENYFEELPDIIQNRIFLSEMNKNETVPEGYFDELPDIIQSRIFLDSLNKENPFAVPQNYFEELAGNIQSHITLESIEKENPFAVPQNYFDELPTLISEKAVEKKQAVIISLFRNKFTYVAAAASVALVIGLSFLFGNHDSSMPQGNALALHVVITKDDIKEYLRNNVDESTLMELASNGSGQVNVQVKGIEKKDVENYLLDNNVDVNEL